MSIGEGLGNLHIYLNKTYPGLQKTLRKTNLPTGILCILIGAIVFLGSIFYWGKLMAMNASVQAQVLPGVGIAFAVAFSLLGLYLLLKKRA